APRHGNGDEVALEPCGRVFLVPVLIDARPHTFLLDTGATTLLNVAFFSDRRPPSNAPRPNLEIVGVDGRKLINGYFVELKSLAFAGGELRDISIPAVSLPQLEFCGRKIEGMLGSDMLTKLGVVIDLQDRVARRHVRPTDLFPEVRRQFLEAAESFN